jgi:hypothetical protein
VSLGELVDANGRPNAQDGLRLPVLEHDRIETLLITYSRLLPLVRSAFWPPGFSSDAVSADVVGHVHRLVGARVGAPATRERAVLAPRAGERRVERRVRDGDRHRFLPDVPAIRQRHR